MGINNLDLKVLGTLKNLIFNNEKFSIRKVSRILGMEKSLRSVQLSVERLKNDGKIFTNEDGRIEIIEDFNLQNIETKLIPLVGDIACGGAILAEEYIEDYVSISKDLLKSSSDYFLLSTTGDSMNEKGINPGDTILIEKQNICNNGDIVVALVNGNATLKEFKKENGFVKLIPHSDNGDNKIIIVTENLIIQGVYRGVNLGKI